MDIYKKLNNQFLKFCSVGLVNTAIDFSILNGLIFIFGLSGGFNYIIFKSISFTIASINSFFFNKKIVFKSKKNIKKVFPFFMMVSLTGMIVNTATANQIFKILKNKSFSPTLAANLGAIIGVIVIVLWKFLGYKFLVFNK